jgi:hypothetical protein
MKKFTLILALLIAFVGFSQSNKKTTKSKAIVAKEIKPDAKTLEKRLCHEENLANSPYKKTLAMPKKERKALGLPPNKYFESEYELTMNPETGRPTFENINALREQLEAERKNAPHHRAPGDAIDNNWIERGPTNVGGRTRAVLFDPNDPTNETAFAGGVSGGLWKNTNISNPSSVWTRVGIPENLAVSCITVDPNNSSIFYVGTGESYVTDNINGNGIWKSTDAGTTWNKVLIVVPGTPVYSAASLLTGNSPTAIAGSYLMAEASAAFSSAAPITTPITNNIVLGTDGTAAPTLCCSALTNGAAVSGKIALIRRGTCNFTVKVKNAQDAGAIAVIIMNNNTDAAFNMGGTDLAITIPAVMISQADGDLLENALLSGPVSVTLNQSNGSYTGYMISGQQHINRIKVRNNAGVSEIYATAGDSFYGASGSTTYLGGTTMGLYKSVDGGATWNEIALPLTANGKKVAPNDIEIASDNKIWLSTIDSRVWANGGGLVFSSADGNTFTQKLAVPGGKRTEIAVSATTPDKVYVLTEVTSGTTETVSILSTTDGFATTNTLALPVDADGGIPAIDFTRGQAGYDLTISVDPTNDQKVWVGGIDIFASSNGGTSWTQKSIWTGGSFQDVHSDQHNAVFAPGAASKMLFANDGGVFYTSDSGTTIGSRNSGFNVTQFYSVGVAPTTNGMPGDNFVGGAQDNGSNMFLNVASGQNSSVEVQGGDGAYSMFDQGSVDKYRITNYVYNNNVVLFNYATNSQRQINSESGTTGDNGQFITPMTLDSNLDVLFADYFKNPNYQIRRYKNLKSGIIRKAILSNTIFNSLATALTVSKYTTTSTTLLIGTRNGKVIKLTNADAGTTTLDPIAVWTNISGPAFVGSVSDVEYGNSENEILVTMHNYNVVSIWYTADGGATWQNKEGNFPDIPVKAILRNPLNNDEVIIGTELGVWRTETFNTANPIWIQSQNGMQNVKVTDLDLRNDNVVYAATYGRGIFSGAFTAPLLANNSFTTNSKNISIAPNPSNGVFNINIDKFSGDLNLEVVDLNGRVVMNKKMNDSAEKSIDLKGFQTGVYVLKITGEDVNYSQKIIKN